MPEKKPDIFDKIMSWKILKWINPFYVKYKEMLLYVFFGGLTTVISIGIFGALNVGLKINEHISNLISWIFAVMFAFFTNRIWVFSASTKNAGDFISQMLKFYSGRLVTLGVEELILWIFITELNFNSMLIKVIAQVVIIILNYIISKLFVFKGKKESSD